MTRSPSVRQLVRQTMRNADNIVLKMVYKSAKETTTRIVSPVRWVNNEVFCALCLGREQCRNFRMDRIVSAEIVPADQVLMPSEIRSDKIRSDGSV